MLNKKQKKRVYLKQFVILDVSIRYITTVWMTIFGRSFKPWKLTFNFPII